MKRIVQAVATPFIALSLTLALQTTASAEVVLTPPALAPPVTGVTAPPTPVVVPLTYHQQVVAYDTQVDIINRTFSAAVLTARSDFKNTIKNSKGNPTVSITAHSTLALAITQAVSTRGAALTALGSPPVRPGTTKVATTTATTTTTTTATTSTTATAVTTTKVAPVTPAKRANQSAKKAAQLAYRSAVTAARAALHTALKASPPGLTGVPARTQAELTFTIAIKAAKAVRAVAISSLGH
jgi:hypothetical protein